MHIVYIVVLITQKTITIKLQQDKNTYNNILARKSGVDYNTRILFGNVPAKRNNKSARKIQ